MSGFGASPVDPRAPILAAQLLFQRLRMLVGGLRVALRELLHLRGNPDVLLGAPLSATCVFDELIRGEVDRWPARFGVVRSIENFVGDARAVDDVPEQRTVDLWCRAHRALEELRDLAGTGKGSVEVIEVGRVVGEQVCPCVPVLEYRPSHEVPPELSLDFLEGWHRQPPSLRP